MRVKQKKSLIGLLSVVVVTVLTLIIGVQKIKAEESSSFVSKKGASYYDIDCLKDLGVSQGFIDIEYVLLKPTIVESSDKTNYKYTCTEGNTKYHFDEKAVEEYEGR